MFEMLLSKLVVHDIYWNMRVPGMQENNSFGSSGASDCKVIPKLPANMLKADCSRELVITPPHTQLMPTIFPS